MPNIKEPSLIAAYMLYDASRLFPKAIRDAIQQQFKAGPHTGSMLLEYLSTDAHAGICSVPESNESHLWQLDIATEKITGTLPEALCATYASTKGMGLKPLVSICGKLARYCADGFLFLNTVAFEDWTIISYRFIHDIAANIQAMPFLWEQINMGDHYKPRGIFTDIAAMKMALNEQRQAAINVGNAYLFGNGWPVAEATARLRYNNAVNVLAEAVLSSVGA